MERYAMTTPDISRIVVEMRSACADFDAVNWASIKRWADRLEAIAQQPSNAVPEEKYESGESSQSSLEAAKEMTLDELTGEAERIATNQRKFGHFLASTIMRELCRRLAAAQDQP